MALFNKKKGADAPASGAPTKETPTSAADNSAFDFDAIARDLDAQDGASSFDSLLAQPATTPQRRAPTAVPDNSVFDFPDDDPLGLNTPPLPVTPTHQVVNAPLSPAPLEQPVPDAAPGRVVKNATTKRKRPSPLVPLLGALALLAIAGGGAWFVVGSQNSDTPNTDAPAIAPRPRPKAPPVVAPPASQPGQKTTVAVVTPRPAPRSASPGIAPPKANVAVKPPVRVARAAPFGTAKRAPSATAGLNPQLAARLKALWKKGAAAKHRRDFKAARVAWTQALQLRPGHPGFQESINKLPKS